MNLQNVFRNTVMAASLTACAHTAPTANACTPDPRYEEKPVVCGDVDGTGRRLCGMLDGSCVVYLLRDSCTASWAWHSRVCEGEETL